MLYNRVSNISVPANALQFLQKHLVILIPEILLVEKEEKYAITTEDIFLVFQRGDFLESDSAITAEPIFLFFNEENFWNQILPSVSLEIVEHKQ